MLHFLTAVVGSTCDVRVKNGAVYEGIFKTLSSQCELAVDAVHKVSDGGGGSQPSAPRIEDVTDTMIFSPADLVTMTCRDVDLTFAVRDSFTDSAIGSSRLNGEHREKVLQRWDGDGNGDGFDLDSDTSNGWDANEMFKFNEEAYGVKSTYDSSLSMYTMPLQRGNLEVYRQREARAAQLASEIESSLQYRRRVSLENDEGRSEEDKYSSVVREREERTSPGFASTTALASCFPPLFLREAKYVPLPQRARETGPSASSIRPGASGRAAPPPSRHLPSPMSVRTACSPSQSRSSPPAASSPPHTNHVLPHSRSHPQALTDTTRSSVNGGTKMSPKSLQRFQSNRTLRSPNSQSTPAASRAMKPDAPPQDPPSVDPGSSSLSTVTMATTTKPTGPTPLFPVDVSEVLGNAAKEPPEGPPAPQDGKNSKAPSVQQRSQLEELRKFGKEFRLQASSSPLASPASVDTLQDSPTPSTECSSSSSLSSPSPPRPVVATEVAPPISAPAALLPAAPPGPRSSGTEGPTATPIGGELSSERAETATQVKNSTLNPNAKEFLPVKGNKPASNPVPPRPTPPSPAVVLPGQPGGGAIYSSPPAHYLSYISPIPLQGHSIQVCFYLNYTVSTISQGKYPRPKGLVGGPRPEHHGSPASSMISASAAGPQLVASPYPQSYLQYSQVIQALPPHFHGQPIYSMLQGARMLTAGAAQPLGPPGPQFPGQADGPPGPQQAMYAPQSIHTHHSGSLHPPQPSSTPTGSHPPPQHTAPSPGHGASQPQSLFHSGGLSAPTPPNLPPGHGSPQAAYAMQGYGLPTPQQLTHGFPSISQLTQAHITGGMSGPHHAAGHGPPPVMLHYAPLSRVAAPTPSTARRPSRGRRSTSTSDPVKVRGTNLPQT
uniref:Ataxin 2-like n=1 Tax=Maylandia zebra TaxID=106582 RepID=A0A3P9AV28_9CICH